MFVLLFTLLWIPLLLGILPGADEPAALVYLALIVLSFQCIFDIMMRRYPNLARVAAACAIILTGTSVVGLVFHSQLYGSLPSNAHVRSLIYTDSSELFEYLSFYSPYFLSLETVVCTLLTVASIFVLLVYRPVGRLLFLSRLAAIVCLVISIPILHIESSNPPISGLKKMVRDHQQSPGFDFKNLFLDAAKPKIANDSLKAHQKPDILVVVIGESLARRHMSLYGYPRDTTPELKKLAAEKNMVVFNNIISPHAHTIESLTKALTASSFGRSDAQFAYQNLIEALNQSGYRTVWLSNQGKWSTWDTPITELAMSASEQIFTRTPSSNYDENLIPHIDQKMSKSDGKKLALFVHMKGSHFRYDRRYDVTLYSYFDDQPATVNHLYLPAAHKKIIDTYDNSVRYTDFVLKEIVTRIAAQKRSAMMMFFSDHGEDVFDELPYAFHSDSIPTRTMYEVPFFVFGNASYFSANHELFASLAQISTRLNTLDFFYDTVLDLLGIQVEGYDVANSWFRQTQLAFRVGSRMYPSMSGIASGTTENGINFADRVWVHRVNDTQRLAAAHENRLSIEVDLVFDRTTNKLLVKHPGIAGPENLQFSDFLSTIDEPKRQRLWLDIKNLNDQTKNQIMDEIKRVNAQLNLKSNMIIESSNASALTEFKEQGFLTSFYIPYFDESKPEVLERAVANTRRHLSVGRVDAISFDARYYHLLKPHFPTADMLIWGDLHLRKDRAAIAELLADERVKIYLGQEDFHDYNRLASSSD